MPQSSYDLIVIGDDFAGLVTATLCARRGMRTLVVESNASRAGYDIGPHRLPVEPLVLPGREGPAIKRVLDELHFDHPLKRRLRPARVSYQYVTPELRLDVAADGERLRAELARELPDDAELAAELCDEAAQVAAQLDPVLGSDIAFPPDGFWERREVGRGAQRLEDEATTWHGRVADHTIVQSLIHTPAALATRANPLALTAEATARAFHHWRHGAPRVAGDWDTLRDMFVDKLENHSGELRNARLEEVSFSWGRANGIVLAGGEEIGAQQVVAALPVSELLALSDKKQAKRIQQISDKVDVAGYRYTLNLVIDEAGVPEGMAHTVLVVCDPEAPLVGPNAFAVYVGEPDDEARVTITVTCVCPPPEGDPEDPDALADALADMRVSLRQRLELVMPFYADHVLLVHSPHEATAPEGSRYETPSWLPIPPRPVWASGLESALGVSAVPYSLGVKRVTIASSQVLPLLGLEGDFAAGWCAAKIVCAAAGKKRDYLKDEVIAGA